MTNGSACCSGITNFKIHRACTTCVHGSLWERYLARWSPQLLQIGISLRNCGVLPSATRAKHAFIHALQLLFRTSLRCRTRTNTFVNQCECCLKCARRRDAQGVGLHSTGVNTLPRARRANVAAILAAHYPGCQGRIRLCRHTFWRSRSGGRLPDIVPGEA
jgi:hypothetical protein